VARPHGISPSLLFHWRRRRAEGGKEAIRVDEEVVGSSEVKVLEKRIRELERVLGKKTPENEILREAVKTVAATLGVSRSQLHLRLREGSRPRGRYQKTGDAEILATIRTLTDERPTYGYRRIWALLNRQRERAGLSRLNHKRIYRLMSQNGLLLQRYTGKLPGRAHDGQIITIRPNLRWTSDGCEIACWNGQSVRVAFALDTCDREVMSWNATTGGISGEMIRDLMLKSVERRFDDQQTPHPIEWLSRITAAVTAPMRPSPSPSRSASYRALRRCDRRNRTAWLSPASKRSSGIMFTFMIARMHNRSWRNCRGGSRTTTTIRTKPCE